MAGTSPAMTAIYDTRSPRKLVLRSPERDGYGSDDSINRHGRACPGHPRPASSDPMGHPWHL